MIEAGSADHEVVVLGAGFAGLAASSQLRDAGVDNVVLEARDRVGGRVFTESVPGIESLRVDLGGQWLGPTQERLRHHVDKHGLQTFTTWTGGDSLLHLDGAEIRYRGLIPKLPVRSLLNIAWAQKRLEQMSRGVPLDAPWRARGAIQRDAVTLGSWLDRNLPDADAREVFELGLQAVFAENSHNISLLHALFYIHSGDDLDMLFGTGGGAQDSRVVGGMQTVAEAMARGLDIRFDSPVTSVHWSNDGVDVRTADTTFTARHLILTAPPRLLADIEFEPRLPADRAQMIASSPMAAVVKCHAVYETPFWREDDLNGSAVSDEGPIHLTFDNSPHDPSYGVLVAFADADSARSMARLDAEQRREATLRCLERFFGRRASVPLAYTDKVWEHDEWAGGCYGAFCPPGLWTSYGHSMRKQTGALHWAGTETATRWSGYIDGAISSGERAAREILGDALDGGA